MRSRRAAHARRRAATPPTAIAAAAVTLAVTLLSAVLAVASSARAAAPRPARPVAAPGGPARAAAEATRMRVAAVDLIGEVRIPAGRTMLGTPLGGLSGITYDAARAAYYAVSDDRSSRAPARYYRLGIDVSEARVERVVVSFTGVVTLTDAAGQPFRSGAIDPEGIVLTPDDTLFIASEGDVAATPLVAPFVAEFGLDGRQRRTLPLPAYVVPSGDGRAGARNNLVFEPLSLSHDGATLFSGTENALAQDGPVASLTAGSPSRLLMWDRATGQPAGARIYPVSPIPAAPVPAGGSADNGFVDVAPLDGAGTLLALERSYAAGVGNTVRLFETSLHGATDVSGIPALAPAAGTPVPVTPMAKRFVADLASLGARPDNIEGMTFGPPLPDGRQLLILVSDDNFNPTQVTQLVALVLRVEAAPPGTAYLPWLAKGE